ALPHRPPRLRASALSGGRCDRRPAGRARDGKVGPRGRFGARSDDARARRHDAPDAASRGFRDRRSSGPHLQLEEVDAFGAPDLDRASRAIPRKGRSISEHAFEGPRRGARVEPDPDRTGKPTGGSRAMKTDEETLILIVDDKAAVRYVTERVIRGAG